MSMWLDLKLECRVGLSSASFLRQSTVGFLHCQHNGVDLDQHNPQGQPST
jgi:hypothetical protein